MTKVCIYGAGAIGGLLGGRLAKAGFEVSAVARGATLSALRTHGWRWKEGGVQHTAPVHAVTDDPSTLGPQDVVIIAVKGPALGDIAAHVPHLLKADTMVLPAINGVPWWFSQVTPALADRPLHSVDPEGRIAAHVPLQHVIGCVVHISASTPEPGLVNHKQGHGLILGEPTGGESARLQALAAWLGAAGFDLTLSNDIRLPLWYKLWGNMTMNPVSAMTGATVGDILSDQQVRAFCSQAMLEAAEVGAAIGCGIHESPEDRHVVTMKLGNFKPSMLQDVEAGRQIELDQIVGAVCEIARRIGVASPTIDGLLGLTRLFAQMRGLYPRCDVPNLLTH